MSKVTVLGAGQWGSTLAQVLSDAGNHVLIWGRDQKVGKKIRMMGDGSGEFTKKMGIELDLAARGLGIRSDRYAMIVEDGVVKSLDREAPGKFEVSDAASILKKL